MFEKKEVIVYIQDILLGKLSTIVKLKWGLIIDVAQRNEILEH